MTACCNRKSVAPRPRKVSARNVALAGVGAAALLVFAASCTAVAGAGAATVAVAAGALASGCYGYVDVKVVDSDTGGPTCEADVIARDEDGDETVLRSCFHAALGEGKWTLTARKAGYLNSTSALDIQMPDGCPRVTYTSVMTLERAGRPRPALTMVRPATTPAAQAQQDAATNAAEAGPPATSSTTPSSPPPSAAPVDTTPVAAAKPAGTATAAPSTGPAPGANPGAKPAAGKAPAPPLDPVPAPKAPSRPAEKPENPYGPG